MSYMGAGDGWKKHEIPWPWDPKQAITFFDAVNLIDVYLDPSLPISREMVLIFFFHETAFSNIRQRSDVTKKNPNGVGPGVGFGQIEIQNSDKPAFIRKTYGISPDDTLFGRVTADEVFAIRMHCDYMKHLYGNGSTTMRALVNGQVGGKSQNAFMADFFMNAESRLRASIYTNNRAAIIDALNSCRWYVDKMGDEKKDKVDDGKWFNPIDYPRFKRYWDFTLPESELMWGIRK